MNRITREEVDSFRLNTQSKNATLDRYQTIATKSAVYPGSGTPLGLVYVALKMNGEAGEFAEHVGKAMRDDGLMTCPGSVENRELTTQRRTALLKEIGDVLWYLSAACNELGTTLSEVAVMNLEKLCDRTERGTLRGSGDER